METDEKASQPLNEPLVKKQDWYIINVYDEL